MTMRMKMVWRCDQCGKDSDNRDHSIHIPLGGGIADERDFCSETCIIEFSKQYKIPLSMMIPHLQQYRTDFDDFVDGWIAYDKERKQVASHGTRSTLGHD